jgi:hypothetical protein
MYKRVGELRLGRTAWHSLKKNPTAFSTSKILGLNGRRRPTTVKLAMAPPFFQLSPGTRAE